MAQRRSLSDVMHDDELKRRGSASARRSFFRRKKHQRNNSKDSRELTSFSDQSINSDSTPFLDGESLCLVVLPLVHTDCVMQRVTYRAMQQMQTTVVNSMHTECNRMDFFFFHF